MEKAAVLEKLGTRQMLKLNKLMDMSPYSKDLFKIQSFNGDTFKNLTGGRGGEWLVELGGCVAAPKDQT